MKRKKYFYAQKTRAPTGARVFSLSDKYFPVLGKASRAPVLQCKTGAPSCSSPNPLKKVAVRSCSQQLKDKSILLYLVD